MNTFSDTADCFISLHAIAGTQSTKVIHPMALVQNQVLSILIDSRSSHIFLNSSMLAKLQCKVTPTKHMNVKVANGQTVISDSEVQDFEWLINGFTFSVDARVLDFAAYYIILGMDWLEQHRPMTCDWLLKWIQFEYQGTLVKLQGMLPSEVSTLPEVLGERLHKLAKGNDIWALVVVMIVSADDSKQEGYLL
jgi:hypothetical protein